jgi:hypothetical protein
MEVAHIPLPLLLYRSHNSPIIPQSWYFSVPMGVVGTEDLHAPFTISLSVIALAFP